MTTHLNNRIMQKHTDQELISLIRWTIEENNGQIISQEDAESYLSDFRQMSLALGKPEPLAKNKQTQLSCDECGSENITSYNDGFREKCNDCGARIVTRKADATSR